MKGLLWSFLTLFAIPILAQVSINHPIASNFSAAGTVLELNVPAQYNGSSLLIGWVNTQGQQSAIETSLQSGKHLVELRNNPLWQGTIQTLAISLPGITGTVKKPSFGDEISLFLNPDLQTPRSINFINGYSLFSVKWSYILYGILFLLIPVFYFLQKMTFLKAILLSFLVAWVLFDLRNVANHVAVQQNIRANDFQIAPFVGMQTLIDKADQNIGEASWSQEALPGVYHSYTQYNLAEKSYIRFRKKPRLQDKKGIQYILTQDPKNRQVVDSHAGIAIVKTKKKKK